MRAEVRDGGNMERDDGSEREEDERSRDKKRGEKHAEHMRNSLHTFPNLKDILYFHNNDWWITILMCSISCSYTEIKGE